MTSEKKVFCSEIPRSNTVLENDLRELVHVTPIEPVKNNKNQCNDFEFQPRIGKCYMPKKITLGKKVKTVGILRQELEEYVYTYLTSDLEKQNLLLLKKIKSGSSKSESTLKVASSILKSDNPISRATWQMITNLNPKKYSHSSQYVFYNGKKIKVCGSIGGEKQFLCGYDISKNKITSLRKQTKRNELRKKKSLLNSLSVNFKPGPLIRKRMLDNSYQRYNVGHTELVKLPKVVLEVKPTFGVNLEPSICKVLQGIRNTSDTISEKWAEFATSTLGTLNKLEPIQNQNDTFKFGLNYKNYRNSVLMRQNASIFDRCINENVNILDNESNTRIEIQTVLAKLLDAVEINIRQDFMYTEDDIERDNCTVESEIVTSTTNAKEKTKRIKELERLDVTIIQLSTESNKHQTEECRKPFCKMGCICLSLQCDYKLKTHCGRPACMFECKCVFSEYTLQSTGSMIDNCSNDLIPGLIHLENAVNSSLAKEEQKFHQTVVLSNDKSIFLKTRKRNFKESAKLVKENINHYDKTHNVNSELIISLPKLNCVNVEPWCMLHKLYKCFCKGRITEKLTHVMLPDVTNVTDVATRCLRSEKLNSENILNKKKETKPVPINNCEKDKEKVQSAESAPFSWDIVEDGVLWNCARVLPYIHNRHSKVYYQERNCKILEMEQNDVTLQKRLIAHLEILDCIRNTGIKTKDDNSLSNNTINIDVQISDDSESSSRDDPIFSASPPNVNKLTTPTNKAKLVSWIETQYKHFKNASKNILSKLEPPKTGKAMLYPWEVILHRYREKKNFFLVLKDPPYRLFISIDFKSPLFKNCIKINDIKNDELDKYPDTVNNLVKNKCDKEDTFYILFGVEGAWELIGRVNKIGENFIRKDIKSKDECLNTITKIPEVNINNLNYDKDKLKCPNVETDVLSNFVVSKWFVMTVENDFKELRFHSRGFYVTYEGILKAISLARKWKKTVRLSSPCINDKKSPQFGLYAIPFAMKCCVFVGPYDRNDGLDLESVNNLAQPTESSTRGVWVYCKKLENSMILENPLSVLKQIVDSEQESILLSHVDKNVEPSSEPKNIYTSINFNTFDNSRDPVDPSQSGSKPIKPIKINKSNAFYNLSLFKELTASFKITETDNQNHLNTPNITFSLNKLLDNDSKEAVPLSKLKNLNETEKRTKPIAEIAPQVKLETNKSNGDSKNTAKEGCMFVLKPEEINKRLFEQHANTSKESGSEVLFELNKISNDNNSKDIEQFIENVPTCEDPNDICIISDDEDFTTKDEIILLLKKKLPYIRHVWLECTNVENFGCLLAKQNENQEISFQFPGFSYSDYYPITEAFNKINQVLSRKIFLPKSLKLQWQVVNDESQLKTNYVLQKDDFAPDIIMTTDGMKHKNKLL